MAKLAFRKLIFVVLLLLQGCSSGVNYAPIIERKERVRSVPQSHTVKRGETLYSIAWRYSTDVRALANANHIDSSYLIFPGQKIVLGKRVFSKSKGSGKSGRIGSKVVKKHTLNGDKSNKFSSSSTILKKGAPQESLSHSVRWQWPAKGKLGRVFNASGGVHKGIDIKGKLGESVHAAGSGKVVYAGSGLVGYGKLLIVKHNEFYLSAYGHNRKLLVIEGELVKAGQRIAEIGDTGTDKVKLHFEIRHDGKPVDPLKLLPRG